MTIIPTRRFWWLVGFGIVIALLGGMFPGLERLVIPYNLTLIVVALITAMQAPRASMMSIQRRFDQVLSVRVQNRIVLFIENESASTITGRLRETTPAFFDPSQVEFSLQLEPHRYQELDYHVQPRFRGLEQFGDVVVRLDAPLGLVNVERTLAMAEPVRVYPNVLALREFELLKQRGKLNLMGIRKSRIKGQGTEFESLREYHEDDYRRIDWKSSARRGKLVVRDYETERNQPVIVCIDAGRHMMSEVDGVPKLDLALDACLMLLEAARNAGDHSGLLVFNDRIVKFLPPRKGRQQSGAILDAIHDLEADPIESDYESALSYLATRWKRRSLIVVFTDAEDEAQAVKLQQALAAIVRRHLVMVVRVSDPKVKELVKKSIETDRDLYDTAAALWYQTERRRAEIRLSGSGVQSIDAEPNELAQALVSAYLVAKERAAL